jgi:hypothetical protein
MSLGGRTLGDNVHVNKINFSPPSLTVSYFCKAPVCSSTCSSSYLRLQVIQSQCLRVISNHPRRTPTSHLHNFLNVEPILVLIHSFTDKFFAPCPLHPNPPVHQTANYAPADLNNLCKKHKHKRTKIYCFILCSCFRAS